MRRWCALVPQKALASAKSRILLPDRQRRDVATAMLRDTVSALGATGDVDEVVVLWDDDGDRCVLPGVRSVSTAGLGLNASLDRGLAAARAELPGRAVVVVPGDLPGLDPVELARGLARASGLGRAYLPDRRGTGTTLLTATAGCPLLPAYGEGSAARHAATGAAALDPAGLDTVRADVDDLDSLVAALGRPCGPHTAAVGESLGLGLAVAR